MKTGILLLLITWIPRILGDPVDLHGNDKTVGKKIQDLLQLPPEVREVVAKETVADFKKNLQGKTITSECLWNKIVSGPAKLYENVLDGLKQDGMPSPIHPEVLTKLTQIFEHPRESRQHFLGGREEDGPKEMRFRKQNRALVPLSGGNEHKLLRFRSSPLMKCPSVRYTAMAFMGAYLIWSYFVSDDVYYMEDEFFPGDEETPQVPAIPRRPGTSIFVLSLSTFRNIGKITKTIDEHNQGETYAFESDQFSLGTLQHFLEREKRAKNYYACGDLDCNGEAVKNFFSKDTGIFPQDWTYIDVLPTHKDDEIPPFQRNLDTLKSVSINLKERMTSADGPLHMYLVDNEQDGLKALRDETGKLSKEKDGWFHFPLFKTSFHPVWFHENAYRDLKKKVVFDEGKNEFKTYEIDGPILREETSPYMDNMKNKYDPDGTNVPRYQRNGNTKIAEIRGKKYTVNDFTLKNPDGSDYVAP